MPVKPFDPANDGFGFGNSWSLDDVTSHQFAEKLASAREAAPGFLASNPVLAPLGRVVGDRASWLISQATVARYGLCGGMAFAARDFWCMDPPRADPLAANKTPSPELRAYLVKRMLDSLRPENLGRVLVWMAVMQLLPLGAGKRWLRDWSRAEWVELKRHLDNDGPWPIALIRETSNPTENHQVLACACDPPGDKGAVYVYDMNYPHAARKIELDFGAALQALEELPDGGHILWRGFFCEVYSPAPQNFDLHSLIVSP